MIAILRNGTYNKITKIVELDIKDPDVKKLLLETSFSRPYSGIKYLEFFDGIVQQYKEK